MTTFFYTHPVFEEHIPGINHPERPERLAALRKALEAPGFQKLQIREAPSAKESDLALVHTPAHIKRVFDAIQPGRYNAIDGDTYVSPQSGKAAMHAVGAVIDAVESVLTGKAANAFCAVRPPGHHAHKEKVHGFCLFNNIAIGAKAAKEYFGAERVAIVDFDVHHGDGTQNAVWDDAAIFFASTHQWGIFPGEGAANERGQYNNILNVPLPADTTGLHLLEIMNDYIIPRVDAFKPDLIMVSAGFDAHKDDPLANFQLLDDDFKDLMVMLLNAADRNCKGRLVSVLEGGYNIDALGRSAALCIKEMMKRGPQP